MGDEYKSMMDEDDYDSYSNLHQGGDSGEEE